MPRGRVLPSFRASQRNRMQKTHNGTRESVRYDADKPNATPRKMLDVSR